MSKRKRSPTKDAGQHRILPILFALVASIPSSQCLRIDPARTEFKKTQTPENGAVKQYSRIDRTQSRRGKFFICLKYKPLKRKKWGANKTNLHRISDGEPYHSEREAEREVLAHRMMLEGFVRGEGDDSKEFFESQAMVSAREKAEAEAMQTEFTRSLDNAAAANDGSSHEHAHAHIHARASHLVRATHHLLSPPHQIHHHHHHRALPLLRLVSRAHQQGLFRGVGRPVSRHAPAPNTRTSCPAAAAAGHRFRLLPTQCSRSISPLRIAAGGRAL